MMPARAALQPDIAAFLHYCTLLDEEAEVFAAAVFDDDKARKDHRLAGRRHGSPEDLARWLTARQHHGTGAFITVNRTDGEGFTLPHIAAVRVVWHEADNPITRPFPLEPTFVVESSPGKYHSYWRVEGMRKEQHAMVMNTMVQVYGSDPNAKDLARVLRAPGFWHQKNPAQPHLVRIVAESGAQPYSAQALLAAFPPAAPPARPPPTVSAPPPAPAQRALVAELAARAARRTQESPEKGRHSQILWLGRECAYQGVAVEQAEYALRVFEKLMRGADTAGQAAPLNWPAELKAFHDAHAKGLANPRPPTSTRGAPPPPAPVTAFDFQTERAQREAYEARIDEADFDTLTLTLFPEVEASPLRLATRELLVKRIARRAGVAVSALRGGAGEPPERTRGRDDWLGELNAAHAVVSLQGQVRIMNLEHCPIFQRRLITFSARSDFVTRYENRETYLNGERTDIGTAWLKHPTRRMFRGIAFLPGLDTPDDVFNLWEGFGVEPALLGSCQLFLDFLRDIICGGCETTYRYVWGWMAHLMQRPAELPGTALVLRGAQGVGKNTYVEALAQLVNPAHYVQLTQMDHLTGKFSAHRAGALLVFANEASWGGDKQAEGPLKSLVTDMDNLLEEKHRNAVKVRNFARLVVASNRPWPVARDEDDRRMVVLDVSESRKEDGAYFAAIQAQLAAGGYETLMYHLLQADIADWHPRQVPLLLRERGWDMKIRSGGSAIEWYFECLEAGVVARDGSAYAEDAWRSSIPTTEVQQAYVDWCRRRGYSHPVNIEELGRCLKRWGIGRRRLGAGENPARPWVYEFPDLVITRRRFCNAITMPISYWEGENA